MDEHGTEQGGADRDPRAQPVAAAPGGPNFEPVPATPGAPAVPVHRSRLAPQLQEVVLAAGLVAAVLLFRALSTLILLVLITVLIAIPLAAVASRLARWRIPRPLGVLIGLGAGIGVLVGLLRLLIPPFAEELRRLASEAPDAVDSLVAQYADLIGSRPASAGARVQEYVERFLDQPLAILAPLLSVGLGVAGAVLTAILVLLTAYYIAVKPEPLIAGVLRLFPPQRRAWGEHLVSRLRTAWVGWLKGVIIDMVVSGVLLYIGLSLLGVELALLFSVFSAILVVIPFFGAIAGGIPPVLFALTDSPERALLVLLVYIAVQQIESNLIIPLVMSQTVRLHPAVIPAGVVAVGALFGVVGLFVAVPIISAVQIVVDELWVRPAEREHERPESAAEAPLPQGAGAEGAGAAPLPGATSVRGP